MDDRALHERRALHTLKYEATRLREKPVCELIVVLARTWSGWRPPTPRGRFPARSWVCEAAVGTALSPSAAAAGLDGSAARWRLLRSSGDAEDGACLGSREPRACRRAISISDVSLTILAARRSEHRHDDSAGSSLAIVGRTATARRRRQVL